jgi:hypothetical protein
MYEISQSSKDRARDLGVKIQPSTKKGKKIDVFDWNGNYIISIGDNRYKDYHLYLKEKGQIYADHRRRLYYLRHKKDLKKIGSAGYYAWHLLWN